MPKIKRNLYIVGIIFAIILGVVCSLLLTKGSEELIFNKITLNSYYLGSNTDFIIPGPAYEQYISIKQDDDNGIEEISPYYSFTTNFYINSKSVSGVAYVFESKESLNSTPYNEKRILKGVMPQSGEAIVDYTFMKKNRCKIGDVVLMMYKDKKFSYTIVAKTESNLEFVNHSGTIAVVLRPEEKQLFEDNGLFFSGAFVKADDYTKCLEYLRKEYKPLSRLKSRDSFDSEESYQNHVEKFNSYDWMKEITDFHTIYKSLSVKYEKTNQTIIVFQVIESAIIVLALFFYEILMLSLSSHINYMDVFMRKNKNIKQLFKLFSKNIVFVVLLFVVIYFALSFGVVVIESGLFRFPYLLLLLLPIIVSLISCTLSIVVCYSILCKRYKNKEYD